MIRFLKKVLGFIVASSLFLGSPLMNLTPAWAASSKAVVSEKTLKITNKTIDTYLNSVANKTETKVYFVNGSDIPYLKVDDFAVLFKQIGISMLNNKDFDIRLEKADDNVILMRENNYFVVINFTENWFGFWDYDAFMDVYGLGLMDLTSGGLKGANGKKHYIKQLSSTYQRYGDKLIMNIGEYGIDLVQDGDDFYIPVQTLSDVFLAPMQVNLLYNGNSIIAIGGGTAALAVPGGISELGQIYYSGNTSGKISKKMAAFNYNELCFALDNLYGLKEQHNISSFQNLMKQIGSDTTFLKTNVTKIDKCIYDLLNTSLDDQHSQYELPSYASDMMSVVNYIQKKGQGRSVTETTSKMIEMMMTRAQYYPNGVPGYQEIGDTAFITLDSFSLDLTKDFYETAPTAEETDSIGIIAYSVQQILRKGSPVKNVVLDLSCNGGGAITSAIYLIGAFLGTASISIENPNSGALVTHDYKVDTNLDGKFNEKDTLDGKGLNLYCLISKISFSCGNLVPCIFKNSGKVTLLGQTSGGGACAVMPLTTATGTLFNISSPMRLSFVKNGSFYDIDRGTDPDYRITKNEHYYDREALVEYIHDLF